MVHPHKEPVNHLIQDAFLTQVRALAEFFYFCRNPRAQIRKAATLKPASALADKCDLKAVNYVPSSPPPWNPDPFERKKFLLNAIDKCVAHLSLGRAQNTAHAVQAWSGPEHLYGTVDLLLKTWESFVASAGTHRPEFEKGVTERCVALGLSRDWYDRFPEAFDEMVKANPNLESNPLPWLPTTTPTKTPRP